MADEDYLGMINKATVLLKLDVTEAEMANEAIKFSFSTDQMKAIAEIFTDLANKKHENAINTLLRLSRLPMKVPKTFENYDFSLIHGKNADRLKNLSALTEVHAGRNIIFIGPPGVGKTHLAEAYGNSCCKQGMKTYFLKASELNDKFSNARKFGREASVINGLVKPTCLIIDEIGRCKFDEENTRMFFDMIDRRYAKEGPQTMIFTSNMQPSKWSDFFSNNDALLSALDRLCDDAVIFNLKGQSYRGKKCENLVAEAGVTVK